MTKKRPSAGFLYDAAILLVCLAFLSSYCAAGILAKYASGGGSGASARVAEWNVSVSPGTVVSQQDSDGWEITYPISINRNTETASTCIITIEFTEDVSSFVSDPHIGSVTPEEGSSFTDTLTFRNVCTRPATDGSTVTDTVDLVLEVSGSSAVADDYGNDIINGADAAIDFTVTVTVVQVD